MDTKVRRQVPPVVALDFTFDFWNENWHEIRYGNSEELWSRDIVPLIRDLPYVSDLLYTNVFRGHIEGYHYLPIKNYPQSIRIWGVSTIGISSTHPPAMWQEGMELFDGRLFTKDEVTNGQLSERIPVLISRSNAELNHFSVGSIFPFYLTFMSGTPLEKRLESQFFTVEDYEYFDSLVVDFEIIGIFDLEYESYPCVLG